MRTLFRPRRQALSLVAVLSTALAPGLAACPSTPTASPAPDAPPVPQAPEVPTTPAGGADVTPGPGAAPASAGAYTLAEWGLVTYEIGADGSGAELVSGKVPEKPGVIEIPPPLDPPVARKPVIYLRGFPDAPSVDVSVTFGAPGRLHEVWPTPGGGAQPAHGASYRWTVGRGTEGACAPGWAPAVSAPACASLTRPEACEAAELEAWVPSAPRCLDVGGVRTHALLYNGFPGDPRAPLAFHSEDGRETKPAPGAEPTLHNVTAFPVGPVFVRGEGGALREITSIAPDKLALADTAALTAEAFEASVLAAVKAAGLNDAEAADFMRAWTPLLRDDAAFTVFGFLSPEAIDAIATLSATPAPDKVVRVMAFTIR